MKCSGDGLEVAVEGLNVKWQVYDIRMDERVLWSGGRRAMASHGRANRLVRPSRRWQGWQRKQRQRCVTISLNEVIRADPATRA